MIRVGQSQKVSNVVILVFTDVSVHISTMGVYDHSLDCIYTEPSIRVSIYIQSYSPSSIHNTSCDRNLSFFLSLFFLSPLFIELYALVYT